MKRISLLPKLLFIVGLFFQSQRIFADVKVPALIADNMVLQQNANVAIWGWADPGEAVEVLSGWGKASVKTVVDQQGNWLVRLKTTKAGGPYVLTIKGKNTLLIKNVLLGEVWLCSGQSNMHFPVAKGPSDWATGVINSEEEIAKGNYPSIRMITVERKVAEEPQKNFVGQWEVCSPQTVGNFSAVAYFFAREIFEKTGFPIGLINSSWGGTPAESWTKKEILAADSELAQILEQYRQDLEKYPQAIAAFQIELATWKKESDEAKAKGEKPKGAPREPIGPNHNKSPYKLYNAMIHPLIPYTLKGVIWYQGESNVDRAWQYRKLFPTMIANWRKDWSSPNLPFYFVQIAPHRSQKPEIREAQLVTMLSVPNTGMSVVTDTGDSLDIHPRDKQTPGKRLALWALAQQYGGKDILYSGPIYKSMKVKKDKIRLQFDYVGGGLVAKDGELVEFTIAGDDQQFVPAKATIEGNSVVVWSEAILNPVAVRFAWRNVPFPNFYNKAGLPASPFRTDTWPVATQGKN